MHGRPVPASAVATFYNIKIYSVNTSLKKAECVLMVRALSSFYEFWPDLSKLKSGECLGQNVRKHLFCRTILQFEKVIHVGIVYGSKLHIKVLRPSF